MSVSIKMWAMMAPLVVCASAVADQPIGQGGNPGKATETRLVPKMHNSERSLGKAPLESTGPAKGERAPFTSRGLSLREKRIFVLGLEAQEKK